MSERTGQPTEEPTQRRWEQAFEEGQLAFSSELVGGLVVLAGILFFMLAGKWFFGRILVSIQESLTFFDPMIEYPDAVLGALRRSTIKVGVACMGLMAATGLLALVAGTLQTRFNISTKALEFKWSKMSPKSGLKRLFSTRSLNRGAVSSLKAAAIVVASYWITNAEMERISVAGLTSYGHMISVGCSIILQISIVAAILMVVVGCADLAFQIWKQRQDLMMTKQEVRDEQKDIEGDPQIRARIKKLQSEMSRQKIVQEVPKASVVVTNPTHFAVALRYDPSKSGAPIVVAKGADHLAKQIIKIAKESGVAVVERKPVARFLYANVKVGREIPYELYQAVAEILNYIRRMGHAA